MYSTLRSIGLDQQLFVGVGCENHYGDEIGSPAKYSAEACRVRTVLEVPRREEDRTVQDEVDVQVTGWTRGMHSRQKQSGPCPLCSKSEAEVSIVPRPLGGEPPTHFFIGVERSPDDQDAKRPPTPSVCVSAFGVTYRLCAVISQSETFTSRIICQALYGGCWHAHKSWSTSIEADHHHVFETNPFGHGHRSQPILFAYVREDDKETESDSDDDEEDQPPMTSPQEERQESMMNFFSAKDKVSCPLHIKGDGDVQGELHWVRVYNVNDTRMYMYSIKSRHALGRSDVAVLA